MISYNIRYQVLGSVSRYTNIILNETDTTRKHTIKCSVLVLKHYNKTHTHFTQPLINEDYSSTGIQHYHQSTTTHRVTHTNLATTIFYHNLAQSTHTHIPLSLVSPSTLLSLLLLSSSGPGGVACHKVQSVSFASVEASSLRLGAAHSKEREIKSERENQDGLHLGQLFQRVLLSLRPLAATTGNHHLQYHQPFALFSLVPSSPVQQECPPLPFIVSTNTYSTLYKITLSVTNY